MQLRNIKEIEEEYLRNHPEKIDDYISVLLDEYAKSEDASALLSSLGVVCRMRGVSGIAETAQLSRAGFQEALSQKGNLQFDSVNEILRAMGYRLMLQKLPTLEIGS
jgi:probable addiction module antidote protein